MIAATFHGPNHFSPNHDETTIELFENIGHAMSALFDRYDTKGERPLPVRYLNGNNGNFILRGVELGDSFECYKIDDIDDFDYGPVEEQQVRDALTDVHTGLWDYRLTLMAPFGANGLAMDGNVSVSVEKR